MTRQKQITTPWGYADSVENIAPGIKFASTPRHGGFFLTADRQAAMPAYFRDINANTREGWYEEDCHAAFVALVFPDDFPRGDYKDGARKNVAYFYPDLVARFDAERGTATRTELTACGEQHVMPGCERQFAALGMPTQGTLWD